MRCRGVQRRMLPYVDGRLTDTEYAAVGAHLQRCPSCAGELAAVRRLCEMLDRGMARADASGTVPTALENATMRRIRGVEAAAEEGPRWRWLLPWATGLAAAGLALYLTYVTEGRDPTGPGAKRGEHEVAAVAPEAGLVVEPSDDGSATSATSAQLAAAPRRKKGVADPTKGEAALGGAGEARVSSTEELPTELRHTPDLFVDFPIIDELDKFEHYDSIWSVTNEHGGRPRGG